MVANALRNHRSADTSRLGISLYTMLAAVVILGVLGSVMITEFSGKQTKAQAALALLENLNAAAKRFHLHTGCYPRNLHALESVDGANRVNSTNCPGNISPKRWQGPYTSLRGEAAGQFGSIKTPQYGPGVFVNVGHDYGRFDSHINDVPLPLAEAIIDACNGGKGTMCRMISKRENRTHIVLMYSDPLPRTDN